MNNSTLRPAGIFLLMLAMLTWTDVRSWDFCQPNKDGIMLYYNYLYDGDACEIAYCEGAEYECVELDIPDVIILSNKNEGWGEDTVLAVVGIGAYAFKEAQFSLVRLPETISEIGDQAFYKSQISAIKLSKEWCFRIGNAAFARCESLTEITIPSCVMEIGESAFQQCI